MAELKATYGNFKVRGIVYGLGSPYAFNEGETKSGIPYRVIEFKVQTSKLNYVPVKLFGMKFDEVQITPKDREDKTRKSMDYTDDIYEKLGEDWEIFMGTNVGVEPHPTEEGKNDVKNLVSYDAVKYIYDNLEDGDVVFINGGNSFGEYKQEPQLEYQIRNLFKSDKGIDFDADNFEEVSTFDQVLVLDEKEVDKNKNRMDIDAKIIYKNDGSFINYPFYIDTSKYQKLALNLHKRKFGTQLKASGRLHSTVDVEQSKDDSSSEVDEWGEEVHKSSGSGFIKDTNKSLEITKVYKESVEDAKYSEEDFNPVVEDNPFGDNYDDNDATNEDPWGESGDGDSNSEDPFA